MSSSMDQLFSFSFFLFFSFFLLFSFFFFLYTCNVSVYIYGVLYTIIENILLDTIACYIWNNI
jgi:hypothetical protein